MNAMLPFEDNAPQRHPVVFARDGEAFANSRDVAAYFDKHHRNVLGAIDSLIAMDSDLALRDFVSGYFTLQATGTQRHRMFDMTRDGFLVLAMGFTGATALRFKRKFIEAFSLMETELRKQIPVDVRDPKQLARIALQLTGLVEEQQRAIVRQAAIIEQAAPKVEFYDSFANAEGLYGLQNASVALGLLPNQLSRRLQTDGSLFKRSGHLLPLSSLLARGLFSVKTNYAGNKAYQQTYLTPKGLQWAAKLVGADDPTTKPGGLPEAKLLVTRGLLDSSKAGA